MSMQQLNAEMNALATRQFRELSVLLRRHRTILDDKKNTLLVYGHLSNLIGLGFPEKDKKLVIQNFLDVQREMEQKEAKANGG